MYLGPLSNIGMLLWAGVISAAILAVLALCVVGAGVVWVVRLFMAL